MHKIFLFFLFFPFSLAAHAQSVRTGAGPQYMKLDGYNSSHPDAFSFTANQACLTSVRGFAAGIYAERPYMLQGLSSCRVAMALGTGEDHFSIQADYWGTADYHESGFALAYARKMEKIDVGVQFSYYQTGARGYGHSRSVDGEGSILFHVSDRFRLGADLCNPLGTHIGKQGGERPVIYSTGFGYDASENLFLGFAIEKVEDRPVDIRCGLAYYIAATWVARAGISISTGEFYLGTGILINGLKLDLTTSMHPRLGPTPGMALHYLSGPGPEDNDKNDKNERQ